MKRQKLILSILLSIIIILFAISPKTNIEACLSGILVWATCIVPALFPFFFFTKVLSDLGMIEKISQYLAPLTKKFYNTNGISAYIYTMSILSGYPMGAKLTADFYEKGIISKGQANRICTFTSTSGPLFIIGTVGIGMFCNQVIGLIILFSHFLGALLNGLIYRKYMYQEEKLDTKIASVPHINKNMLEECMLSSIKSILIVGGYIAIFFTIITMLNNTFILTPIVFGLSQVFSFLHIDPCISLSIVNGMIEITKGCLDLSLCGANISTIAVVATGIISFGGISIMCQALTFLKRFQISLKFYFLQKTTHAIISMIISFILVKIFI